MISFMLKASYLLLFSVVILLVASSNFEEYVRWNELSEDIYNWNTLSPSGKEILYHKLNKLPGYPERIVERAYFQPTKFSSEQNYVDNNVNIDNNFTSEPSISLTTKTSSYIQNVPTSELNALLDLYTATNGAYWKWRNDTVNGTIWDFNATNANPCADRWQGIYCHCPTNAPYCSIWEIDLTDFNMTGTLPSSMLNLTYLTDINFPSNKLHGTFPAFLAEFPELHTLQLEDNRFSGTIPFESLQFKTLEMFGVGINKFTGVANVSSIPSLRILSLFNNSFSGAIFSQMVQLPLLIYVEIENNNFREVIPKSIDKLRYLYYLSVGYNSFYGKIPASMGDMKLLRQVYMTVNELTGTIPPSLGNITYLAQLDIGSNHLTHTIPNELTHLSYLRNLILANNFLEGTIPLDFNRSLSAGFQLQKNRFSGNLTELSTFPRLKYLDASSNYFTGPLPEGNFDKLASVFVDFNRFSGSFAITGKTLVTVNISQNYLQGDLSYAVNNTDLRFFYAANNFLTGSIPDEVVNMKYLSALQLTNNFFKGTIPSNIGKLMNLVELLVQSNTFTGTLPASIQNLTFLEIFFVSDNQLRGQIQDVLDLSKQRALQNVDFSSNRLTGTIPSSFFTKENSLISFAASANCFTGSIPTSICQSQYMTGLALSGLSSSVSCTKEIFPFTRYFDAILLNNYMVGGIPLCLFNMSSLFSLHLAGNGFTGSLPKTLVLSSKLVDLDLSHNVITGEIPYSMQRHSSWTQLTLSYNKFRDVLIDEFVADATNLTTLGLETNRISGRLPLTIKYIKDIEVLDGNMFACDVLEKDLPVHDPRSDYYSCGSDLTNRAFYLWLSVLALPVVMFIYWIVRIRQRQDYWQQQEEERRLRGTLDEQRVQQRPSILSMFRRSSTTRQSQNNMSISSTMRPSMMSTTSTPPVLDENMTMNANDSISDSTAHSSTKTSVSSSNTSSKDSVSSPMHSSLSVDKQRHISTVLFDPNSTISDVVISTTRHLTFIETANVMETVLTRWQGTLRYQSTKSASGATSSLVFFQEFSRNVRKLAIVLTAVIVCIFLPIYGGMTTEFQSYKKEYAWSISAALLSGKIPAGILFVIFSSIIVLLFYLFEIKVFRTYRLWRQNRKVTSMPLTIWNKLCIGITFAINLFFMMGANIAYVTFLLESDTTQIAFIQLCLAGFKLAWNELVLWRKFPIVRYAVAALARRLGFEKEAKEVELLVLSEGDIPFFVFVVLLNNILLPIFAISMVETNCFQEALFAAKPVYSTYQYDMCSRTLTGLVADRTTCIEHSTVTATVSYEPPFLYSYQCASTLVIDYIPVFVYYFAMVGMFVPCLKLSLRLLYAYHAKKNSPWRVWLSNHVVSHIYRDPQPDPVPEREVIFNKLRLVVKLNSYIALMLAFGVIFPPLALVGCISVIVVLYMEELAVGRLLYEASVHGYTWYRPHLEKECAHVSLCFFKTIWMIIPFPCFIYAYLFFDTLGDEMGWQIALPPSMVLCLFPIPMWLTIYLCRIIWPMRKKRYRQRLLQLRKQRQASLTPVQTVEINSDGNKSHENDIADKYDNSAINNNTITNGILTLEQPVRKSLVYTSEAAAPVYAYQHHNRASTTNLVTMEENRQRFSCISTNTHMTANAATTNNNNDTSIVSGDVDDFDPEWDFEEGDLDDEDDDDSDSSSKNGGNDSFVGDHNIFATLSKTLRASDSSLSHWWTQQLIHSTSKNVSARASLSVSQRSSFVHHQHEIRPTSSGFELTTFSLGNNSNNNENNHHDYHEKNSDNNAEIKKK